MANPSQWISLDTSPYRIYPIPNSAGKLGIVIPLQNNKQTDAKKKVKDGEFRRCSYFWTTDISVLQGTHLSAGTAASGQPCRQRQVLRRPTADAGAVAAPSTAVMKPTAKGSPRGIGSIQTWNLKGMESCFLDWVMLSFVFGLVFAHAQGTAPWNMLVLSMGWGGVGC